MEQNGAKWSSCSGFCGRCGQTKGEESKTKAHSGKTEAFTAKNAFAISFFSSPGHLEREGSKKAAALGVRLAYRGKSHFARTPKPWLATGLPTQPAHVRVSNSGRECGKVVAVALVGTGVARAALLPNRAPRERNGEPREPSEPSRTSILTPARKA